jgi:hypothetical protein
MAALLDIFFILYSFRYWCDRRVYVEVGTGIAEKCTVKAGTSVGKESLLYFEVGTGIAGEILYKCLAGV